MPAGAMQPIPLAVQPQISPGVEPGEYFCTDRELYRVERLVDDRVLLEDCRTDALIEVGIEQVLDMNPVTPSAD